MDDEFKKIKTEIKHLKGLGLPNYKKPFILRTDASNVGLGTVLLQEERGKRIPIEWASRKLTSAESRYGITEKEMLACFWAINKFEYELRGRKFIVETDHRELLEMREKPYFTNNRLNRWIEKLQEFDFEIKYVPGKLMGQADELSREQCKNNENSRLNMQNKKKKDEKHVVEENGTKFWRFD